MRHDFLDKNDDVTFRPLGFCFPKTEKMIYRDCAANALAELSDAIQSGKIDSIEFKWETGELPKIKANNEIDNLFFGRNR